MNKRILALLVTGALLLTALAGCTQKSGTGTSGALPDKLTLTIERPIFTSSPTGTLVETTWLKALEEYMGIPLDLQLREVSFGDYGERLTVYLASGDWADIFLTSNGTASIYELGEDGLLLNLRDYPEQTKNFFALAQGNELKRITAPGGGIYGFSDLLISTYNGSQETILVNVEVFEKNGIKVPETLDELYNVAKRLKALYPDSFPITGGPDLLHNSIFLAFGEQRKRLYYNGQEFVYGPRQPGYKQGVEFLHKLYAEGLLDPEYFTQPGELLTSKFYNDKNFISFNYSDDPVQHPGKVLGYIPYMSADGSDIPYYPNDNAKGTQVTNWANIVINAKTKYPELAVKLVDFQYSREMLDLFNWGVEGVTFTRNPDGSKQFSDEIMNAPSSTVKMAEYGINTSYSVRSGIQFVPQDRDVAVATMPQVPSYINGNFNQTRSCWKYYDEIEQAGKSRQYPLDPPVVFTAEQQAANTRITTAVNTYADESLLKFITGEISLNSWDAYLAEMKNFGDIDVVLNNYNSQL